MKKFINMKFVVFTLALILLFPGLVHGGIIYSTTDYSTSAIGVITQNVARVQNSYADGDIRLIPFDQSDSEFSEKLVVALRNSGTIEIYDRQDLSSPLISERIGNHNIHSGVYYNSSLFLLDMGSYRNDSALYRINPNNGRTSRKLTLAGNDNVYKFYAQEIFESDGSLIVLMQRYKTLDEFPWVEHKEGELLKINPGTLQIEKRWELNKNPMDMILFNDEVYIISIGGAQGVTGNIPKFEVIKLSTGNQNEIGLWSDNKITEDMNEPQKIAFDSKSSEIYLAVSSVMDTVTYQTLSDIYRFDPKDNTVSLFSSFPNGSITCMDYDTSNDTIVTLFSDYSTYSGSIKVFRKSGTLLREYLPTQLGGNAYQSILVSAVTVSEKPKTGGGGGGCNLNFHIWILMLLPALLKKIVEAPNHQRS